MKNHVWSLYSYLSCYAQVQQTIEWWYFSYFSQTKGFAISCKLSSKKTICIKCQILFAGKNKKKKSEILLLIFSQYAKHWNTHCGFAKWKVLDTKKMRTRSFSSYISPPPPHTHTHTHTHKKTFSMKNYVLSIPIIITLTRHFWLHKKNVYKHNCSKYC